MRGGAARLSPAPPVPCSHPCSPRTPQQAAKSFHVSAGAAVSAESPVDDALQPARQAGAARAGESPVARSHAASAGFWLVQASARRPAAFPASSSSCGGRPGRLKPPGSPAPARRRAAHRSPPYLPTSPPLPSTPRRCSAPRSPRPKSTSAFKGLANKNKTNYLAESTEHFVSSNHRCCAERRWALLPGGGTCRPAGLQGVLWCRRGC